MPILRRTLTKIDESGDGAFAAAASARQSGEQLVRGVKCAIVTSNGEDPAGHVDRGLSGKPLVQGLDFAVTMDSGGDIAGGHFDHGRTTQAAVKGVDVAVMVENGDDLSIGHLDRGPVVRGIDVAIMTGSGKCVRRFHGSRRGIGGLRSASAGAFGGDPERLL
ncbi:MAG: hypothetical protein AAAC47_12925 [Pararhizobium sp.]